MVCSDSFSFDFNTAASAVYATGSIGTNCAEDYLVIESKYLDSLCWILIYYATIVDKLDWYYYLPFYYANCIHQKSPIKFFLL